MNTITLPSTTSYPDQLDRIRGNMGVLSQEAPETMGAFSALHEAAAKSGALDFKTKELIALAIAVSLRCDGCIAFHTHDALRAGATPEEIMEALGVAVLKRLFRRDYLHRPQLCPGSLTPDLERESGRGMAHDQAPPEEQDKESGANLRRGPDGRLMEAGHGIGPVL